jgi:hypothetical protein
MGDISVDELPKMIEWYQYHKEFDPVYAVPKPSRRSPERDAVSDMTRFWYRIRGDNSDGDIWDMTTFLRQMMDALRWMDDSKREFILREINKFADIDKK